MNPLSVLVTGSSGFIGTHVVRHLHEAGHEVMALDQMPPKDPLPDGVRFYECDIRQGMLPNGGFDAVVHLAALAGVRPSMDRKLDYEITNVVGTLRLLEHCRQFGTPHFVFALVFSAAKVPGAQTRDATSTTPSRRRTRFRFNIA